MVVGASFALLISTLIRMRINRPKMRALARALSSVSYTMYLFHFPLFAFMAVSILGQEKERFGWPGFVMFLIFMITGLTYSCAAHLAFERRTDWVRRKLHVAVEMIRGSIVYSGRHLRRDVRY
jgi:peptidoglycan/LPS O-acetylase OafA/YrhL